MVVKTETCAFSEYKIYPGHGLRVVRTDGNVVILSNSKCKGLLKQRKKPSKLVWTQAWRRANKKLKVEQVNRKKTKKSTRFQRAIVGASLDEIKKVRTQKPSERQASRDQKMADMKVKAKQLKDQRKAEKKKMGNKVPVDSKFSKNFTGGGKGRKTYGK